MKVIECPRDAMQGIHQFIPTEQKAAYINLLLKIGFDTIDFGSFVSPKAIPQMADTAEVLKLLDFSNTKSNLLAIVANERGAKEAIQYDEIHYLGFPFSLSPTFQLRNTNTSQTEAINRIQHIQDLCLQTNKELVVYLSMGFGNPYGDIWNSDIVREWVEQLASFDIPILSLADTVGAAQTDDIFTLYKELIPKYKQIEFGAHFHSTFDTWSEKVEAAVKAGCSRFDSTIKGIGGCPLAQDSLVGNLPTEHLLMYIAEKDIDIDHIQQDILLETIQHATKLFSKS